MSLKTKNVPLLTGFVLLNLFVFFIVNGYFWNELISLPILLDSHGPLMAIALHLVVLVLSYFLPESMKNKIVYWRLKNSLPGTRAFSELAPKDPRIDLVGLEKRY